MARVRSEEHTSELQSRRDLVCRLLLEKRTISFTLLCSTIMVAVFGVFQEIVGDYTSFWLFFNPPQEWFQPMEHRVPSLLNYSNSLAGYLNLVLPFGLACFALGK